jgi:hypothetical protein
MITIFTVPKAFKDHIALIQRNAIRSWLLLHPDCEVILLGNDEGTSDIASEFGLSHIPDIAYNEYGTPLLNSVFEVAQSAARHAFMIYSNADIILMSDFMRAVHSMPKSSFLMTGQRWEIDIHELISFNEADWEENLRKRVGKEGMLQGRGALDYFAFYKGFWNSIPPFAIGRTAWDNWLIYYARSHRVPVIDATEVVTAVHQNHEYKHHPKGFGFIWKGPESQRNLAIGGNGAKFILDDATLRLTSHGFKRPKVTANVIYRRVDSLIVLKPRLAFLAKFLLLFLDPLVKIRKVMREARAKAAGRIKKRE